MTRSRTLVALTAVFAFALACGGHSVAAKTAPSPPLPTVVSNAAPTHPIHLRAHDYHVTWKLELDHEQPPQQFLVLLLEPYTPGLQTVTVTTLRTIDPEGSAKVTVPREGDYKVTALTASPTWTVTLTPLA